MRIGQLNNAINFSRAIPLKSPKNKKNPAQNYKLYSDICDIVNGKPSKTYSQEDSQKIRDFFYGILGDCSQKNPVEVEKSINGNYVLLSGKEANEIRFFKEKAHQNVQKYKKDNGIPYATKVELINRADKAVSKSIQYKSENGIGGKPESSLIIHTYKGTDKKQHINIKYFSVTSSVSPSESKAARKEKFNYVDTLCDYNELEI